MNRRKSVVLNSASPFTAEKKTRSPFSFRRGDSSRDVHTQLPSTPPGRDSPSGVESFASTPPASQLARNESRQSEDPDAITPIPEVTPNGTNGTANHSLTEPTAAHTETSRVN
jgi:hypothetical protein